jgi:hypothetical protein
MTSTRGQEDSPASNNPRRQPEIPGHASFKIRVCQLAALLAVPSRLPCPAGLASSRLLASASTAGTHDSTAVGHDLVVATRDLVLQLGREARCREEKETAMVAGLLLGGERRDRETGGGRRHKSITVISSYNCVLCLNALGPYIMGRREYT